MKRREFVKRRGDCRSGLDDCAATISIVPRNVLGRGITPPSDLLNIAGVGIGEWAREFDQPGSQKYCGVVRRGLGLRGQGFDGLGAGIENLKKRSDSPDPEPQPARPPEIRPPASASAVGRNAAPERRHLPRPKRYSDYREMLEKQRH
jgi:hypothetical protein